MSRMIAGELLAGIIYGDTTNQEYVYLPAGEVGSEPGVCIFESHESRQDLPLEEAAHLAARLSLRPVQHPRMGPRSF